MNKVLTVVLHAPPWSACRFWFRVRFCFLWTLIWTSSTGPPKRSTVTASECSTEHSHKNRQPDSGLKRENAPVVVRARLRTSSNPKPGMRISSRVVRTSALPQRLQLPRWFLKLQGSWQEVQRRTGGEPPPSRDASVEQRPAGGRGCVNAQRRGSWRSENCSEIPAD